MEQENIYSYNIYDENNNIYCFARDVLDDYGNPTGILVDSNGHFYRKDDPECKDISYWKIEARNPRQYIGMNLGNGRKNFSAPRLQRRAFDLVCLPYEQYNQYEVNHVDSRSGNNTPTNLEWTNRKQNMAHYAKNKRGSESYPDYMVAEICQNIIDGMSRAEIMKAHGCNGQLVDDIRAGRSHKDISSQYVKDGFEYSNFNREEYDNKIRDICELLEKGVQGTEIVKQLNLPNPCFVYDIKHKRKGKHISKDYNF